MNVPTWLRTSLATLALAGVLAFGIWKIQSGLDRTGYQWKWSKIPEFIVYRDAETGGLHAGLLLKGLAMTLRVSIVAIALSLALGMVVGICRITRNPVLSGATRVYVELVRGTPLLVQIYAIYFLVGSAMDMSKFAAAVTALTVFTSAYVGEIVRGGIDSIDRGQSEAAHALGLSWTQSMTHVIMPQAMRRMVAPLTGQFISLIKDSSLVSVVAVKDLTLAANTIQGTHFIALEVWLVVALLYLSLTFPLSMLSRYLEGRFAYR